MRAIFHCVLATVLVLLCAGTPRAAEVMILGVWHMDGPGRDLHNLASDDVLLPKRQRELADIAEALARFGPTKVVVESPAAGDAATKVEKYSRYLDGELAQSRNEVVQIGFRLANLMRLPDVWGIDVEGTLPYEAVQRFARRKGSPYREHLDALNASVERLLDGLTRVLKSGTLADALRYLNDAARIERYAAFYAGMQQFADAAAQPGPDLVASWQARNAEICARLASVVRSRDRVVVVFGFGHAYELRRCVREARWQLVEASEYLPK